MPPRRRGPRLGRVLLASAVLALFVAPGELWAATGSEDVAHLFLALAAMLAVGRLFGDLAERIGQPAVLGELLAGVLLGRTFLGIVPVTGPEAEYIYVIAELGVILLLFEIGLETDLAEMFRVGRASLSVAIVGVAIPFGLGFLYWMYAPHPMVSSSGSLANTAVFIGATLTATSVGITARVLTDLGAMGTKEARVIVGAAVIDDVLGLVMLTVVSGLAAGTTVSVFGVSRIFAVAVGFLVAAVLLGRFLVPTLFDVIQRMRVRHVLLGFAFAFMLGLAAVATFAGSAMIIGAFAAGLILSGTNQFDTIKHEVEPISGVFAPIFFVSVGAQVDFGLLNPFEPGAGGLLMIALILTLLAFIGKLVAGWAAPWEDMNRLAVGVGMIPRGEVGLIFADIGRRSGLLGEEIFGAVLLMVMATTFVAPIGLKLVLGRKASGMEDGSDQEASSS
ncbi:MAG: cation:proton antiporter [Gemmatimonadales bacterium]